MFTLYIMRVLRVKGEVIGIGWTGEKVFTDLAKDEKTLRRVLKAKGLIKARQKFTYSIQDENCIIDLK